MSLISNIIPAQHRERLKLFWALSRTPHGLIDMAGPCAAALLCLGHFPSFATTVIGCITLFAGYTAVYALNDVVDLRNDKENQKQDMEMVYDLFPILAQRRTQMGGTLSGGEQQMLAISRALMARPRLLLLDEPSLGLAPLIIKQIFETIKKINEEQKTTIFLVEQNANQALKLAHRGYDMENGAITLADSAESLLSNEDVKSAYLGI